MAFDLPGLVLGRRLAEDAVGLLHAATASTGPVGVRLLRPELAGREDARLLFAEEARRIAALPRDAFVVVQESRLQAPLPHVVTEALDAPDLERTLTEQGPLPAADALALAQRCAASLALLATRRQLHAAPVPARLLRLPRGWVWLTFRDLRAADEAAGLKGRRPADARYAPPEMAAEHPEPLRAGPWMAFATGALLRACLGLGPPASDNGTPVPLPAVTPAALRRPLERLLDPSPRLRVPDPAAALALLSGAAGGGGTPSAPAPGDGAAGARPPAPRPAAPVPRRQRERG